MSSKFANCKIVMYDEDNNIMWTRSSTSVVIKSSL